MIRRVTFIVATMITIFTASFMAYAANGVSLEIGYASVGGYYSDMLRDAACFGLRIVPMEWEYFFADGALSITSFQLSKSSYSQLLVSGVDAGFNARYRFGIVTPFVGSALGARSFYFSGKTTGDKLFTLKPAIGARAGVIVQFNERLYGELRSDYCASSLSGKLFSAFTQSAGFTYQFGIPEPQPRIIEVKKIDYYGDGMHALSAGDIVGARDLLSRVDQNDSVYTNAHNLVVDIDGSLSAYEEGKRLVSENKKTEAIVFLERASLRVVDAARILESVRAELKKEIGGLERNGVAAYDASDYSRCMTIMKRILLIDPNNQTAKTYLPRAEKREEAIRKLK